MGRWHKDRFIVDKKKCPCNKGEVKKQAIFKIQSEITKSFREILRENDFTEFQAPKIVGGDAEGGAEVYKIDYFGNTAGLATSPQLYKQIMTGVFERVFTN